ncbi:MAG: DUF4143 domain-containing protein [archaeon]|nr:DUF4143 domain-containing protein [archaeon]
MTLTPNSYRPRLIEERLNKLLRASGAVHIKGPKWCGKTWVALNVSNSSFMIGDSNNYGQSNRELAETNIRIVLEGEKPRLIDEWQDVPRTWDAVRSEIDRNALKGQYLLTGSSTPKRNRPVHSGTGRISPLQMRTMSLYEMGESDGCVSLADILDGKDIGLHQNPIDLDRISELVYRGGWPGNLGLSYEDCRVAIDAYVEQILEDASTLDDTKRNKEGLRLVLKSLARNECTLASVSKIHADTDVPLGVDSKLILTGEYKTGKGAVSYDTVYDYLDVFDRLYLINNQPAFDPNLKSSVRVGKTPKRHLADPSIALSLLRASPERTVNDLESFGYYFESMCERDLDIYAESMGAHLYHYRDGNGTEVDAIVELPDGRWGAFEIKLGANKIEKAAEDLLKFKAKMERNDAGSMPCCLCIICGLTEYSYRREDGIYVVPITSLRP